MASGTGEAIRNVGLDELKEGLLDGSITLVDVREPPEIAAGAIPGAISMPLSSFDPEALPDGRVVFSCGSGVRSIRAIEFARAAGRQIDEHFAPGFRGWVAAGEPVEVPLG